MATENTDLQPFRHVGLPEAIENTEQLAFVVEKKRLIEAWIKKASEFFSPMKKKAHEAHKAVTEREAEALAPAKVELAAANGLLAGWQRRAREAAESEAAQRRQEEARRQREDAEKAAREMAAAGAPKMAEQIRQKAEAITPETVKVTVAPPKVEGLKFRKERSVEIRDMVAFVRFCGENKEFCALLEVRTLLVKQLAAEMGAAFALPGIVIVERDVPMSV